MRSIHLNCKVDAFWMPFNKIEQCFIRAESCQYIVSMAFRRFIIQFHLMLFNRRGGTFKCPYIFLLLNVRQYRILNIP